MKGAIGRASRYSRHIFVVGVLLIVIGFYLPWFSVAPTHDGVVPDVLLFNMNAGITPSVLPWLIPLPYLAIVIWADNDGRVSALLASITGVGYAWFPHHQVGVLGLVGDVFVPASGVYVTSIGGGIVLLAGILHYFNIKTVRKPTGYSEPLDQT